MSTVPRLPHRSRLRWARVAAGIFAVFALISRTSAACSCGGDWTPAHADVVFEGQAVEVHEPMHLKFRPLSGPRAPATLAWGWWAAAKSAFDEDVVTVFRVRRSWKATVPEFVSVNTGSGLCCNCTFGPVFDEGVVYVVYAAKSEEREYVVVACAGTAVASSALPSSPDTCRIGADSLFPIISPGSSGAPLSSK